MYDYCPECSGELCMTYSHEVTMWWCDNYNCPGYEAFTVSPFASVK